MGTTALWQSTDRTSGHGLTSTGDGSRRRVREFRIGSDTFADLRTGEAVIHTIHAHPTRVIVDPLTLPDNHAVPRISAGGRDHCEIAVDASVELPATPAQQDTRKPAASKRKRTPAKNGDAQLTLARAIPTSRPAPPTTSARAAKAPDAVRAPDTPSTTDGDLDDL